MPRIDDKFGHSVVFLYKSGADAHAGVEFGGSGFCVGVRGEYDAIYVVTNDHVIQGGFTTIRINTEDGKFDVLRTQRSEWVSHDKGDDVAVYLLEGRHDTYNAAFVASSMFLTPQIISERNLGPGNDVFMVGRFVNHAGKERNLPTYRFGNIGQMPWEPIFVPERAKQQESFLVDMRSRTGFSGSPVFVYLLPPINEPDGIEFDRERTVWLLGVDWGQIRRDVDVTFTESGGAKTKGFAKVDTGLVAVVPIWKLGELLDQPSVQAARKTYEENLRNTAPESHDVGKEDASKEDD